MFMENTMIKIDTIREMLSKLSDSALEEVSDFIAFLLEKEHKRKAFIERVLQAEKEPTIKFNTPEEAMKAILNAPED